MTQALQSAEKLMTNIECNAQRARTPLHPNKPTQPSIRALSTTVLRYLGGYYLHAEERKKSLCLKF